MHKMRHLLLAAALLAVLVGLSMRGTAHAASSQQAQPQVTCQGDGCDSLDPITTGCDNGASTARWAYLQDPQGNTVGEVDLRFSQTCGTNWTRVISYIGSVDLYGEVNREDGLASCWGTAVPAPVSVGCPLANPTTGTHLWTDMVYSPGLNTAIAFGCINTNDCYSTDWG